MKTAHNHEIKGIYRSRARKINQNLYRFHARLHRCGHSQTERLLSLITYQLPTPTKRSQMKAKAKIPIPYSISMAKGRRLTFSKKIKERRIIELYIVIREGY
jgi:hypothetical protein